MTDLGRAVKMKDFATQWGTTFVPFPLFRPDSTVSVKLTGVKAEMLAVMVTVPGVEEVM